MKLFLCIVVLMATLFCSCEARCRFPGHPNNGHIACASPNLLDGEKCRVVCDRGHYVSGEKEAVCKNGQWTATLGSCEAVKCPVPKTSALAIVKPKSCLTGPSTYETACRLTCPPGYYDEALLYCNASGKWEGRDVECVDNENPDIKCPKDMAVETDPGKATAKVRLPKASYSDNSQKYGGKVVFKAMIDGNLVSVSDEQELTIGNHYVRYDVRDETGRSASCHFAYRVEDKEPPTVQNCPHDITKTTKIGQDYTRVSWKEPQASDNSGEVHSTSNRVNHSYFHVGQSLVSYMFRDRSGNTASCQFSVFVKLLCVDRDDFPIQSLFPLNPPKDTCSIPAKDPTKCDQPLIPQYPSFVWKMICRKTCNAC